MSLLDDARKLMALDPFVENERAGGSFCVACTWDIEHNPSCSWLSMPRILAALEAAQEIIEPAYNEDGLSPDNAGIELWVSEAAYDALAASMKEAAC